MAHRGQEGLDHSHVFLIAKAQHEISLINNNHHERGEVDILRGGQGRSRIWKSDLALEMSDEASRGGHDNIWYLFETRPIDDESRVILSMKEEVEESGRERRAAQLGLNRVLRGHGKDREQGRNVLKESMKDSTDLLGEFSGRNKDEGADPCGLGVVLPR